jgi:CDP-diacylglycerol---glycerol-3-phosphate 3-phosphatidyltransferase
MRNELRQQLQLIAVLGSATLCAVALLLAQLLPWQSSLVWLVGGLLMWLMVWLQAWRQQHLNRLSLQTAVLPTLGAANELTLFRGWLIAACTGFLVLTPLSGTLALLAALLYTVAAIADRLDGWLARRSKYCTELGNKLDTAYDALGLLVVPLLAVLQHKLLPNYLLVSIAYYLFVAGLAWRNARQLPQYPLLPSTLRRTLAGMQMGVVAFSLWPALNSKLTQLTGLAFMTPLLLGFVVDWCVVSGRLCAGSKIAIFLYEDMPLLAARWLLPWLRVLWILLCSYWFTQHVQLHVLNPPILVLVSSALCLTFGMLPHLSALVFLLCVNFLSPPSTALDSAVVIVSALLLQLGSGHYSLWQADQRWLQRQDGAA